MFRDAACSVVSGDVHGSRWHDVVMWLKSGQRCFSGCVYVFYSSRERVCSFKVIFSFLFYVY